jgi:hypothetical protein
MISKNISNVFRFSNKLVIHFNMHRITYYSSFWSYKRTSICYCYISRKLFAHGLFIVLMVEAIRTSETSVYFNETIRRCIPESRHIRTRRRENLKSHQFLRRNKWCLLFMSCKNHLQIWTEILQKTKFIIPFPRSFFLLPDDFAGRIARQLWCTDQVLSSVTIISPWFPMLIHHMGDEQ